MLESPNGLIILGGVILLGFAAGRLIGLLSVPAVAGYVMLGVLLGDSFAGIVHQASLDGLQVVGELALGAIAFTIGMELEWRTLRTIGRSVLPIVVCEALGAMALVTAGVWLLFGDLPLALVLGSIAAATAPAATVMVIQESRAAGTLTSTLLAVVGIDDAIALILFAAAAATAKSLLTASDAVSLTHVLGAAGYEIGGSLLLGALIGTALGWLAAHSHSREGVLTLTIASLLLVIGLAEQFALSSLLAIMALGAMMGNIAPLPCRNLRKQVASLSAPILIAFFVLAGAHLRVDALPALGWLAALYLLARFGGKLSGAWLGARIGGAPPAVRNNIGYGLLSQVGIAIGLSLVVINEFTPLGTAGAALAMTVVNILLGTTLVTELVGPILTRRALTRAGEIGGMDRHKQRAADNQEQQP